MRKKILTAALAALLLLSGCSALVEGEYRTTTAHRETMEDKSAAPAAEVQNYQALYSALFDMISSREEYGVIRFVGYDGIAEADISEACMDITYNTPLGSYSVYNISSTVTRIVSYYEAEVEISYKKTARQMNSVRTARSMFHIENLLHDAIESNESVIAIQTDVSDMTAEGVRQLVMRLFLEEPGQFVCEPQVSVHFYPDSSEEKIVEVQLEYPISGGTLQTMREVLSDKASEIEVSAEAEGRGAEGLLALAERLAALSEYMKKPADPIESSAASWQTAYGAIVSGRAGSRGFALAYKLLCDRYGTECMIVKGRLGDAQRYWNIVRVGENYSHIDVSALAEKGGHAAFLSDQEMSGMDYRWSPDDYPPCIGPVASDLPEEDAAEEQSSEPAYPAFA